MASLRIFWEYVWVKVHFLTALHLRAPSMPAILPQFLASADRVFLHVQSANKARSPSWTDMDKMLGLTVLFLWDQVLLWNLLKHAGYRVLLHVEPYSFPCFSDFFVIFVLQLENCHTWDCESSCSGCLLILMAIFGSLGVRLAGTNLFLCSTVAIHSAAEVSTGTPQVDPDGFRRAMVSW